MRCTENLKEMYCGLIIISGDGLVHEVVNGLAQRSDWDDICDIPMGIVPGGSGNALNCSILHQLGMPNFFGHDVLREMQLLLFDYRSTIRRTKQFRALMVGFQCRNRR